MATDERTLADSWSIAGIRVPKAEWGVMINMGLQYVVSGQWWITFFPGTAIALTVMGFNLIGDGLQDVLDPRRR